MEPITMPSITSLSAKLARDYPHLTFEQGEDFAWHPKSRTITYSLEVDEAASLLLHETAHAALEHTRYLRDIELLRMEQEAWNHAQHTLAPAYDMIIDPSLVAASLDTYRDWLHKRSLCPNCQQTGIQDTPTTYRCLSCSTRWEVNEARTCRLKRRRIE